MLPSADPLMKQLSVESTASALTGESWAWKLWRWIFRLRSRTLIQPRRPPLSSTCCLDARARTVEPDSWQLKPAEHRSFRCVCVCERESVSVRVCVRERVWVCMCVWVCVCVIECVCVWERERECVCVCVCVCERGRERVCVCVWWLTVNQTVCRRDQRIPQTHVPVTREYVRILLFL